MLILLFLCHWRRELLSATWKAETLSTTKKVTVSPSGHCWAVTLPLFTGMRTTPHTVEHFSVTSCVNGMHNWLPTLYLLGSIKSLYEEVGLDSKKLCEFMELRCSFNFQTFYFSADYSPCSWLQASLYVLSWTQLPLSSFPSAQFTA